MTIAGLRKNWFALSSAAVLLAVAVAKYRHGLLRTDGTDAQIPYAGALRLAVGFGSV